MIEELKKLLAEYPENSAEYRVLAEAIKKFEEYLDGIKREARFNN